MVTADTPNQALAPEQQQTATRAALPAIFELEDGRHAPAAPREIPETGVDQQLLIDMAIKIGTTVPHFTTEWISDRMRLPVQMVEDLCWQLKEDHLLEILGQTGPFSYRYATTDRGREYAKRLLEISGYVGPAPVSLPSYNAMISWQADRLPEVTLDAVEDALSDLVLPRQSIEVAALAAASARSLFLFGPAGNGKTSIGRMLNTVAFGDIWIPYAITVDAHIIRVFDPQYHEVADVPEEERGQVDRRWVRVKRPFVVAGGEMTLDEVDLSWSQSLRFYEAPLHVKANGGTFLIDDLGRQQVEPEDLLNRWIVPLENRIDFLSLLTGQKLEIPFRLMLIVATNLTVSEVADPAFLRRMGYRLHVTSPEEDAYARIFTEYAARQGVEAPAEIINRLLQRYKTENRELRASEPRDLVERARDICKLRQVPFQITSDVIDMAWFGYFGNM